LGVSLQSVDDDIAGSLGIPKNRGEIVRAVQPGDPAAKAGIQQGDVIVAVDGKEVNPDQTVSYLVANIPVGTRVPITVIRNGKQVTIPVTITQRPTEEELSKQLNQGTPGGTDQGSGSATQGSSLGLSLQPMSPQIARALNLPAGTAGVVITAIDPSSDAAEKGLQRGDVIVAVQGQRVTTPAQVAAAVDAAKRAGRTSVLLLVKRGSAPEAFIGIDISGG
jgi:serine protease Do